MDAVKEDEEETNEMERERESKKENEYRLIVPLAWLTPQVIVSRVPLSLDLSRSRLRPKDYF